MVAVAIAAVTLASAPAMAECERVACSYQTENGTYKMMMPAQPANSTPVVVMLHGYGSNGRALISIPHVITPMLNRGYAVIAPDALPSSNNGPTSWSFHPSFRRGRDEVSFLKDVLNDAATHHKLDLSRVLLSGFSIGGSMTAYIACETPNQFSAYAPIGGLFWRPHPTSCQGPVKLFHTHGWRDGTVPLEGRAVSNNAVQGDVFASLGIWRNTNRCDRNQPDVISQTGAFLRRAWTECATGSALEFALFPGGHVIPRGWADMVLTWFDKHVQVDVPETD